MSIKKIITGLILSSLLSSGMAVANDWSTGASAYQVGDFKAAIAIWTPLAKQGNLWAQYDLGYIYLNGKGVPENYKAAKKWFTLSAEQGYSRGQHQLGLMYLHGKGVPENHKIAVKWLTLAAEKGNDMAQYALGYMHYLGKGVPQNYKTAAKLYIKSAEQGHAFAQLHLGHLYQRGQGVLTDYLRAYMWYNLASYNELPSANKSKELFAKKLTASQIITAQEMSSRCLESGYTDC